MADPDLQGTLTPMTDADIDAGSGAPSPTAPSKNGNDDEVGTPPSQSTSPVNAALDNARSAVRDGTATLRDQAGDKARGLAQDGKARVGDALGQLTRMLDDAAGQVDDRLGAQYGDYARDAADRVRSFGAALDAKSVDELVEDARAIVRKSPAVAIGAAAAVGFVVARLLTAGIDQRDA